MSRKSQMQQGISESALKFRTRVKRDLDRLGITVSRKLASTINTDVGRLSDGFFVKVSYMDYGKILQHLSYKATNPNGKIAQNKKAYRKIRSNERRMEREIFKLLAEVYASSTEDMFMNIRRS